MAERPSVDDVLAEFRRRKVPLSAAKLRHLAQELTRTFAKLQPVRDRIRRFDDLAEHVVWRLYGVQPEAT